MRRAHLKTGIALALRASGGARLVALVSGARRLPLVIGYHRVVADRPARVRSAIPPMLVSRRMLERHLDWIGRRFRFVSLDELGSRLESGEGLATPLAAVTFDDGYRDVYDHAFPLLARKGIPAAVFVVADWIGNPSPLPHDRLYLLLTRAWPTARDVLSRLGVLPPGSGTPRAPSDPFSALRLLLTTLSQAGIARVIAALEEQTAIDDGALEGLRPLAWEMLAEMRRAGITVGSHTRTHPVLTRETQPRVSAEIAGSRSALQARLGTPIDHFAYPDGAFDAEIVEAVAAAGYRFAYTTCRHRDPRHPLLTIPRRLLWENSCLDAAGRFSSAVASCLTHGVFDLARGCGQRHGAPVTARRDAPDA
ncbi:MAG: polysaccharide deacetylase family protein [Candidatus Rokubacteria bacterium]|nr:polysaccharide deacetylase family protein [Candidatus Rokubacteria bacterium]